MAGGTPVRQTDDSICLHCGGDLAGRDAYPLGDGFVCHECDQALRERPFPKWLKGGVVAMLTVVVFSFFYNWRFIQAHLDMLRLQRMTESGRFDLDKAIALAESAAKNVPESTEAVSSAARYGAIRKMREALKILFEDGPKKKAIELVESARPHLPPEMQPAAAEALASAEMGLAFDHADYDRMLKFAEEFAKSHPNEPRAQLAEASALAAKYAKGGEVSHRQKAKAIIDKALANAAAKEDPEVQGFVNRIEHRLATREIVKRKDFEKRFPNGWKAEDKTEAKP